MDPWLWTNVAKPKNFTFDGAIDGPSERFNQSTSGDQAVQWAKLANQSQDMLFPKATRCNSTDMFAYVDVFARCTIFNNVTNDINGRVFGKVDRGHALEAGFTSNNTFAGLVSNSIQSCLQAWCKASESCKGDLDGPCYSRSMHLGEFQATYDCLNKICERPPLPMVDPDIGGIGIVVSYFMQVGIVLLGSLVVLSLLGYLSIKRSTASKLVDTDDAKPTSPEAHLKRIFNSLEDFQKAQCYFGIALEIAAIVFLSKTPETRYGGSFADYSALVNVAQTGIIPVLYNMYMLYAFHRPHRYLSALTVVTIFLSGVVSLHPKLLRNTSMPMDRGMISPQMMAYMLGKHGPEQCGHWPAFTQCTSVEPYIDHIINAKTVAWGTVILLPVIPWMVWRQATELGYHVIRFSGSTQREQRRIPSARSRVGGLANFVQNRSMWSFLMHAYFQASFLAMVAVQIYYLNTTLTYTTGRSNWGFGQIVGVTVWIPSLVEFAYKEIKALVAPELPLKVKKRALSFRHEGMDTEHVELQPLAEAHHAAASTSRSTEVSPTGSLLGTPATPYKRQTTWGLEAGQ